MRQKAGWTIIVISCVIWTALIAVPFLPLTNETKIYWGGALFIAGEVTWYGGLFLLGPEALALIRLCGEYLRDRLPNCRRFVSKKADGDTESDSKTLR